MKLLPGSRCGLGWTLALLALGPAAPAQESKTPSRREQEGIVKAFLALDERSEEGFRERMRLLAELDRVPPLKDSDLRRWGRTLPKLYEKGRRLEAEPGRHWFWPEEERGLYLIGGQTEEPTGLFIGMHGGGAGSGEASSAHAAYSEAAAELGWVGVFPEVLEKTEHGWTDSGTEELVLDLIDAARRTWEIDADRVWLGGHSMGGYGTWSLGAHHADQVAALAPSAGAPTPIFGSGGDVRGIQPGIIPCLRNVPMVIFQSTDDPRVPPDANRFAVGELERARRRWGGFENQVYWEVDGNGHALAPGGAIAHLKRIAPFERDPHPDQILWEPSLPWKRQFYWLWWEKPRAHRTVMAALDRSRNAIRVDVPGDASDLWVLLSKELVDMDREVEIECNDEVVWRGIPERRLSTLILTGTSGDPGRTYLARVPLAP